MCLVKIDRRVRWRVSCIERPTSSMACVLYRERPTSLMVCVLYRERTTSSMACVFNRGSDEFGGVCLV